MIKDNKITRIFLGFALIGIWGLVIYRVVDAMKGKDIPNIAPMTYWIDTASNNINETYQLHLGYNDPFLRTGSFQFNDYTDITNFETEIKTTSNIVSSTTIENLLPAKIQKVQFPSLEYIGVITNKHNRQQLAIVKHNNQTHRIRQGDKIANCTVLNIQKDSIQISLNGEVSTIKR